MISGEQNFIAIEENLVSARVPGRRDQQEIVVNSDGRRSSDDAFNASCGPAFTFVQDARAVKVRGKLGMVGDIVTMRQQHEIHAAHFLHAFYEGSVEAWRIDEDVAALLGRAHDQIGPRAEARFRCEAAKINVVHDVNGKSCDAGASVEIRHGADGGRGARNERHERAVKFAGILRLLKDARFATVIAKTRGRNLAASVAANATFVDVEFARDILRKPMVNLGHKVVP